MHVSEVTSQSTYAATPFILHQADRCAACREQFAGLHLTVMVVCDSETLLLILSEEIMGFYSGGVMCLALLLVLSVSACGYQPAGEARYAVAHNDAGAVTIMFAEQRDNRQYCIYRKDFAIEGDAAVSSLDMQARGDAQLLTPRTVAADDLRRAVQAESVYTSYTFSTAAYAVFPTATVCLAAFTAWVATRSTVVGRATLLTCGAGAALVGAAMATEAEGSKKTAAAVDAVLSTEMHRADATMPRIEKVLTWLVTENSLPCDAEQIAKRATP